jgi:serine/threonine protein kinase
MAVARWVIFAVGLVIWAVAAIGVGLPHWLVGSAPLSSYRWVLLFAGPLTALAAVAWPWLSWMVRRRVIRWRLRSGLWHGEPLGPDDPRRVAQFKLRSRLGGGTTGDVYLGRAPGELYAAVKVVHRSVASDHQFRARFAREVDALRRVHSDYVPKVIDAQPEGRRPWLATAYVPGPSLYHAISDRGAWDQRHVCLLAVGIAQALRDIHAAGFVHRDVKPSNVLLAADGPRLIDFGLARALDATMLTQIGTVVGTAQFISPEQSRGERAGQAADVFSFGALLAYAATGRAPFGDDPVSAPTRIRLDPPNLNGIDGELRKLIEDCLAKDPALRPTATDVLARCRSLTNGASPTAGWLPGPTRAMADTFASQPIAELLTRWTRQPEPRPVPRRREAIGGTVAILITVLNIAAPVAQILSSPASW